MKFSKIVLLEFKNFISQNLILLAILFALLIFINSALLMFLILEFKRLINYSNLIAIVGVFATIFFSSAFVFASGNNFLKEKVTRYYENFFVYSEEPFKIIIAKLIPIIVTDFLFIFGFIGFPLLIVGGFGLEFVSIFICAFLFISGLTYLFFSLALQLKQDVFSFITMILWLLIMIPLFTNRWIKFFDIMSLDSNTILLGFLLLSVFVFAAGIFSLKHINSERVLLTTGVSTFEIERLFRRKKYKAKEHKILYKRSGVNFLPIIKLEIINFIKQTYLVFILMPIFVFFTFSSGSNTGGNAGIFSNLAPFYSQIMFFSFLFSFLFSQRFAVEKSTKNYHCFFIYPIQPYKLMIAKLISVIVIVSLLVLTLLIVLIQKTKVYDLGLILIFINAIIFISALVVINFLVILQFKGTIVAFLITLVVYIFVLGVPGIFVLIYFLLTKTLSALIYILGNLIISLITLVLGVFYLKNVNSEKVLLT